MILPELSWTDALDCDLQAGYTAETPIGDYHVWFPLNDGEHDAYLAQMSNCPGKLSSGPLDIEECDTEREAKEACERHFAKLVPSLLGG